mmetsp:Transcript_22533/g.31359  ORF Transcript_22533/g.31359 Transcript_22533/m.31359 type:complete len:172 (+) Transcript_22533:1011-1526(+)
MVLDVLSGLPQAALELWMNVDILVVCKRLDVATVAKNEGRSVLSFPSHFAWRCQLWPEDLWPMSGTKTFNFITGITMRFLHMFNSGGIHLGPIAKESFSLCNYRCRSDGLVNAIYVTSISGHFPSCIITRIIYRSGGSGMHDIVLGNKIRLQKIKMFDVVSKNRVKACALW